MSYKESREELLWEELILGLSQDATMFQTNSVVISSSMICIMICDTGLFVSTSHECRINVRSNLFRVGLYRPTVNDRNIVTGRDRALPFN